MAIKIYFGIFITLLLFSSQKKSLSMETSDSLKERIHMIDKTHKNKFRWMINRRTDSLEMVLHEDVMYIHSNGWQENKQEVLENIASGKLEYIDVQIQESETRIFGNTGIVTGKGIFKVSLDKKPIEIHLLYTEVYSMNKNKVVLLSRHACRI